MLYAKHNPGCTIGAIGHRWREVDRDLMRVFDEICDKELKTKYVYNQQRRTVIVPEWGWRFDLCSGEEPDSFKGLTWAGGGINEPGVQPEPVLEVALSRLRAPASKWRQLCLTGTPEGIGNWLAKPFVVKPVPGYRMIFTETSDNPSSPPGYVDNMLASYDPLLALEKVKGRFVNTQSGLAYYAFRRKRNVVPGLKAVSGVPWRVAIDFNVDPFIASLCQLFDGGCPLKHRPPCIHVLREIVLHRADTSAMASAVAAAIAPQRPQDTPLYPDATGARETTQGVEGSDFALLQEAGFIDLRTALTNPRQRDRVAVANGLFNNALGEVRLVYSDECAEGIADREAIGWHLGKLDSRDKARTHAADGVDYMAFIECPVGGRLVGGAVIL